KKTPRRGRPLEEKRWKKKAQGRKKENRIFVPNNFAPPGEPAPRHEEKYPDDLCCLERNRHYQGPDNETIIPDAANNLRQNQCDCCELEIRANLPKSGLQLPACRNSPKEHHCDSCNECPDKQQLRRKDEIRLASPNLRKHLYPNSENQDVDRVDG